MTFQPGNKLGKGRPKGAPNKNLRDKLLNGLAKSGAKKAQKAGLNGKVDGFEYFIENLADTNSSAAASLVAKLIPPEEQKTNASGYTTPIIVNSVISGNQFAPGKCGVLLPFDECEEAWKAYHAGDEAWSACLKKLEPMLTKPAFEALSLVVPPPVTAEVDNDRPSNVMPLRLIEDPIETPEPQLELSALEEKLLKMDHAQLLELARALNVGE